MTTNQTPADPSAYRVTFERNAAGSVHHIEVETLRAPRASYRYGPDEIDELIACAREEERSDRYDDRLPSDHAFICAVLRAHGLPILGEQDEDTSWRDVIITMSDTNGVVATGEAGICFDANKDDEEASSAIRAVASGERDSARIGGGAAPLTIIVRGTTTAAPMEVAMVPHPPAPMHLTVEAEYVSRERKAQTGRYIIRDDAGEVAGTARSAPMAHVFAAAPMLLAAAREAEAFMAGFEGDEAQDPPVDERLARLRAAIARAEDR